MLRHQFKPPSKRKVTPTEPPTPPPVPLAICVPRRPPTLALAHRHPVLLVRSDETTAQDGPAGKYGRTCLGSPRAWGLVLIAVPWGSALRHTVLTHCHRDGLGSIMYIFILPRL